MTEETRQIKVPAVDWNGKAADMRSRLMTWEWHWKLPAKYRALSMDFRQVSFMEPWALAMFAAYGMRMRESGVRVTAELDPANPSNIYFSDMGLKSALETGSTSVATTHWSGSHQNTGLHVIRAYADLQAFLKSSSRLTLAHCEDAADALKYAMSELSRNVLQHAHSEIGGVAIAQHFPEQGRLQVALCDAGRGVSQSLRDRYPELRSDMECLRVAILPHSSGAKPPTVYGSGTENAGLGLFYSREIAWRAGGSFWIASGTALLGVRGDKDSIWEMKQPEPDRVYRSIQRWQGTVVVLDFPVNGILDFSAILKTCGQLADEARRLSGPAGLDFVGEQADLDSMFSIQVHAFEEDNQAAIRVREGEIRPHLERGEAVLLDFKGVRAPTQSFVHALLSEIFKIPGSLARLSFVNCTPSAREVLKAVAAYASYKQIV